MNDEVYAAQKARIKVLIERWTPLLGLRWWEVTYEYDRDGREEFDDEAGRSTIARCRANWKYLFATIIFNMPIVATRSDNQLEDDFVHECVHIFLDEMDSIVPEWTKECRDHAEHMCSMLARAFIWTRNQSLQGAERGEDGAATDGR